MGRKLEITLSSAQRSELELHYRTGSSHVFRQRCRIILLKADGTYSKDICPIVGIKSQIQVNGWVKRYQSGYADYGIAILHNAEGQGRKPIFDKSDTVATEHIKELVKNDRQRLSQAQEILAREMNTTFDIKTLKRFLKNLTASTNG
jgi:transposase